MSIADSMSKVEEVPASNNATEPVATEVVKGDELLPAIDNINKTEELASNNATEKYIKPPAPLEPSRARRAKWHCAGRHQHQRPAEAPRAQSGV